MYGYRIVPRLKLRGFRQLPVRFIVGELPALRDIPMYKLYHQWTQQYGPTFMYFAGASPIVVTSGAHSGSGACRVVLSTGLVLEVFGCWAPGDQNCGVGTFCACTYRWYSFHSFTFLDCDMT